MQAIFLPLYFPFFPSLFKAKGKESTTTVWFGIQRIICHNTRYYNLQSLTCGVLWAYQPQAVKFGSHQGCLRTTADYSGKSRILSIF